MISKFTSFGVEAEVCAQVRHVRWSSDTSTFIIEGIGSMLEAAEIIQKLSSGGVATFGDDQIERMARTDLPKDGKSETAEQRAERRAQAGAGPRVGDGPLKAHPIQELKDKNPALWAEAGKKAEQEAKPEPPKAQPASSTVPPAQQAATPPTTAPTPSPSTPAPAGQPTSAASTSPPAAGPATAGEDWRAFKTFTRIGQIVDGLRQLVGMEADFDTIWAKALQVQQAGACPAMDAAMQQHGGLDGLKIRIQTHCASKKVAGAVPPAPQAA